MSCTVSLLTVLLLAKLKGQHHKFILTAVAITVKYSLRVLHSPFGSMNSPGWHSQLTIPEAVVTVRMLSGQAQA